MLSLLLDRPSPFLSPTYSGRSPVDSGGLQWTPVDSNWTWFPARSEIVPAKLPDCQSGGLQLDSSPVGSPVDSTGLQSSWQSSGLHWTDSPQESTRLQWTPVDSAGLHRTGAA